MEKKLTAFFFRYMLKRHFRSMADMSRRLNINTDRMRRLFRTLDDAKGGTIALDKLLLYCAKNAIAVDSILRAFLNQDEIPIEGFHLSRTPASDSGTSFEDFDFMMAQNVNCHGTIMAKAVLRMAQAARAILSRSQKAILQELLTLRALLQRIIETAHRYLLSMCAQEEAAMPHGC